MKAFRRHLPLVLMALTLAWGASARQVDDPWAATVVTVTAPYPGPALWKAVSGDHVVWILGVPAVTISHAAWDARHLEALVAGAEAVYFPPTAAGGLGAAFKYLSSKGLPGGQTLAQAAAPEDYATFQTLAGRYGLSVDDYAHDKPAWAGLRFRTNAFQKMKLPVNAMEGRMIALAKAHNIPIRTIARLKPNAFIDALSGLSEADGRTCFGRLVADTAFVTDHVEAMTAAWTAGDMAAYTRLSADEPKAGCIDAALDQAGVSDKGLDATVMAIEDAMSGTRRGVVVLPIRLLVGAQDLKARLRTAGIDLQSPVGQ